MFEGLMEDWLMSNKLPR